MKVISNSSPLINFAALERLDLLHTLYGTIAIPDAVYQEVVVAGRGYPDAAAVEQAGWIVRESVHTATAVAALRDLGPGEAEAIILAVEHPGSLLLLDDRQGRLAASRFGINVIGTLGVLLVAKRKGLVIVVAKYKSPLKGDGIPVMGWHVLRRCFGLLSNACLDFPPLIYGDLY